MVEKQDEKKIVHIMKNFSDLDRISVAGDLGIKLNSIEKWSSLVYFTGKDIGNFSKGYNNVDEKSKLQIILSLINSSPEAVFLHQYYSSFFQLILQFVSKLMNISVIISADMTPRRLNYQGQEILEKLKQGMRNVMFFVEGLMADKIWCRTKKEIQLLKPLGIPKNRFFVIPHFYDFKVKTEEKSNYIMAVSGWWSDIKNLHTALQVFKNVLKEGYDIEFNIIGKFHPGTYHIVDDNVSARTSECETGEEYKIRIKNLIRDMSIEDKVNFLGYKSGEELEELYRKAKIYYLPSKSETFGTTIPEAMAAGTPPVVKSGTAMDYQIKNGETGFVCENEKEQKETIIRLLEDESLYQEIQNRCMKEAEKYKLDNLLFTWEEKLKNID